MWQWTQQYDKSQRVLSGDIKNTTLIPLEMEPGLNQLEEIKCNVFLTRNMNHWRVQILADALSGMGSPITFTCVRCPAEAPHKAGYSPKYNKMWVCVNKIHSFTEFRRVMIHEMVHAFDFARAQIDPTNCDHIACTEVRAYNMSKECSLPSQLGAYFSGSFTDVVPAAEEAMKNRCISQHVLASLRDNPHCKAKGVAEAATQRVFDKCKKDVLPFDRQPEFDWAMTRDRNLMGRFWGNKTDGTEE